MMLKRGIQAGRCLAKSSLLGRNLTNRRLSSGMRHDIRQGGSLYIDALGRGEVQVEVVSQWQDHVEVNNSEGFGVMVDEEGQVMSIQREETGSFLRVITPESINIFVRGDVMNLSLRNKMEGDIVVECTAGSVHVDKVRGMTVNLDCGEASLVSTKLIEGDAVNISCGEMKAKMVNGEAVRLISTKGGIDIGAAYINRLDAEGSGDVKIDLLNGESRVVSTEGNLKIANVDGAFSMRADTGNVHLQVNKLVRGSPALSAGGGSVVAAPKGGIQMSLDPEIRATLDAQCRAVAGRAVVSIVSDSFEERRGLLGAGSQRVPPRASHVQGSFTGDSAGSKRPTFTTPGSRSSGKIDLVGAESQAMQQTMTKRGGGSGGGVQGEGGKEEEEEEEEDVDEEGLEPDFDLTLRSHGHIRVQTLSWVEIIRRKHGFGHDSSHGLPPSGVGRTASAKERISLWMDSGDPETDNETK